MAEENIQMGCGINARIDRCDQCDDEFVLDHHRNDGSGKIIRGSDSGYDDWLNKHYGTAHCKKGVCGSCTSTSCNE